MSMQTFASRLRGTVLETIFQLLYTRLNYLHEPVGRVVYGAAWDRRRLHVVPDDVSGTLLDLGCGEGRLLSLIRRQQVFALGIEPSPAMTRRASRRGVLVIRTAAQSIPLRESTIQHVIATYPGPWIIDSQTWDEVARITVPGATIRILLGGDITRGRGAGIRSRFIRLAYGSRSAAIEQMPSLGNDLVVGEYSIIEDKWGQAIVWSGVRHSHSS